MLALEKIQDVGQQVVLAGSVLLPASSDLLASCQTFLVHLLVFVEFFGHWPRQRQCKQQIVASAGQQVKEGLLLPRLRLEMKIIRQFNATQPTHVFFHQEECGDSWSLSSTTLKKITCSMATCLSKIYCPKCSSLSFWCRERGISEQTQIYSPVHFHVQGNW